jgi:ketosteroid isomerase-like protein
MLERVEVDVDSVLAANSAFYAAFEARDLDAMAVVWERSERAVCTHPGWSTLHGWGPVGASWAALLSNAQRLQFIVTNERVNVSGDVAWVSCDENLLAPEGPGGTVAALNVFSRHDEGWLLVAHHGSPVAKRA